MADIGYTRDIGKLKPKKEKVMLKALVNRSKASIKKIVKARVKKVVTVTPPVAFVAPLTVVKLPQLTCFKPYMGCDPEFFFRVNKKVVGAEHHLPKDGLVNNLTRLGGLHTALRDTKTKFIIDGVQAELNPRPDTCRANLANEISVAFRSLKAELDKKGEKVELDFARSIVISKDELGKLDVERQKFGCMPSNNSYKDTESRISKVDPLKYRQRSAGGHIHIGFDGQPSLKKAITEMPDEMVAMLDIICGNTCVLIDRDVGNRIRRRLYGRAGEYRLPKHGIEYRTLSNFWLTHYYLMSMAFGLARLAVNLVSAQNAKQYIEAFKSRVDMKEVQAAINNNDFDLAYKNFKAIEPLLIDVIGVGTQDSGINASNIKAFHYFVQTVKEHGLEYWFKEDPVEHWTKLPEAHHEGFTYFLTNVVSNKMKEKTVV